MNQNRRDEMSNTTEIEALKAAHRGVWESGNYTDVADRYVGPLAEVAVERAGIEPGHHVLDIATGAGNAALIAARHGAAVTGLDLAPGLLATGELRARSVGLEVDWVEGDAEALPFADESFDRVLSVVGVQFAPRHEVAAAELARVLRPGGRVALTAWTPDSFIGKILRTVAPRMPKPPAGAYPPPLWGDEDHVADLLAGSIGPLELEIRATDFAHESEARFVDYMATHYGPLLKARERLEPLGEWDELRAELIAVCERFDRGEAGVFRAPSEYLVASGTRLER
jgi:SAM-dependent methyltransferase